MVVVVMTIVLLVLIVLTDNGFYRATACNATHGIAVGILSVRLSVRSSVCLSVRQMRVL